MLPEDYPEHAREYSVEEYSLDELAKGLARGSLTRGRMLKLAGATLLGGVISAAIPGVADARKKKRRTRCTPCLTTSSMPSGTCCLTSSGGTSGCLVPTHSARVLQVVLNVHVQGAHRRTALHSSTAMQSEIASARVLPKGGASVSTLARVV